MADDVVGLSKSPSNNKFAPKLTPELRRGLVLFLAKGSSQAEAVRWLNQEHGTSYTTGGMAIFAKQNAELIEHERYLYLRNFDDIPLAHTKTRVVELWKLYDAVLKDDATKGIVSYRPRTEILAAIRDEMAMTGADLAPHGTKKEAEEFLASVGCRPADLVEVSGDE